jgi:hypothetical protein
MRLFQKSVYKNMVTLYKNLWWYNGNKDFVLQYENEKDQILTPAT